MKDKSESNEEDEDEEEEEEDQEEDDEEDELEEEEEEDERGGRESSEDQNSNSNEEDTAGKAAAGATGAGTAIYIPKGWKVELTKYKRKCFVNELTGDKWYLNYDANGNHYFYNANNESAWQLPRVYAHVSDFALTLTFNKLFIIK